MKGGMVLGVMVRNEASVDIRVNLVGVGELRDKLANVSCQIRSVPVRLTRSTGRE